MKGGSRSPDQPAIVSAEQKTRKRRKKQPGKTAGSRHEQGVMISIVDESEKLIPEQRGQRSAVPCPTLIRRGLDCDRIMEDLAGTFLSWEYRQGTYY